MLQFLIYPPMQHISETIINWYEQHKRDLPWRNTRDPYKIWISEIILQQTRVNQGYDYYLRFTERFPDVKTLAEASEDEVLKYWQGLGYYSRARNLHKAAHQIMKRHGGNFPASYPDVLDLAGIGVYTASAICSFAYDLPFAVVDGNVFRVLSRLFGIDTPIDSSTGTTVFRNLADELLDKKNPGLYNQAIMDFGALQCTPVSPECSSCPLSDHCQALSQNAINKLPVKSQKVKSKKRYFNYLFIRHGGNTLLQKRTSDDIWKNLYEFPLLEDNRLLEQSELLHHDRFQELFAGIGEVQIIHFSNPVKHILTHRQIFARFIEIEISELNEPLKSYQEIAVRDIDQYAVSRLMEIFIENIGK